MSADYDTEVTLKESEILMTQIEAARRGEITPEMEYVARARHCAVEPAIS